MLGAQRTTVTITARSLQTAGLITYRRGRIAIVDRKGLEKTVPVSATPLDVVTLTGYFRCTLQISVLYCEAEGPAGPKSKMISAFFLGCIATVSFARLISRHKPGRPTTVKRAALRIDIGMYRARFFGHKFDLSGVLHVGFLPGETHQPPPAGHGHCDKPISAGSPWQNGFAERLIGTIRRECVDHLIVFGEAHLRRVLIKFTAY